MQDTRITGSADLISSVVHGAMQMQAGLLPYFSSLAVRFASAFVSEADIMLLVLQKVVGGVAFAAEIVVGVLGNVTCFIALAEERP